MAAIPMAPSAGISHVLLASSAGGARRVLTDVGLEVIAEDPALALSPEVTMDAQDVALLTVREKLAALVTLLPHPAVGADPGSRLLLVALTQVVFKDPTEFPSPTAMVVCVLAAADEQGVERREYVSTMRVQLSLLPGPVSWALQSKPHVVLRDMLLKPEPDALPMVTAAALAIEAMATGLVMDALNDVLHTLRILNKRIPSVSEPLDDWEDYGELDAGAAASGEEEQDEGEEGDPVAGEQLAASEVTPAPHPGECTPERPKSRCSSLPSPGPRLLERPDQRRLPVVPAFCSVDCLAAECTGCGAPFGGAVRRMWCPACYATVCPACCASPLAACPDSLPAMQCRSCATYQMQAYRTNHAMLPSDPWAKDEALHGGDCDVCGALFDFFRRRFYCQQCLRRVCSKCLPTPTPSPSALPPTVGSDPSDAAPSSDKPEATDVPDHETLPPPPMPRLRCVQCTRGGPPRRSEEGVDWVVRQCTLCRANFTLLVRRHWCRQCRRTICGDCSAYPLSNLQRSHPDCMCMQCYKDRFAPGRRGVDKAAPACLLCGAKFTLFWRRHWCRKCGRTICTSCSAVALSLVSRRHPNCVCRQCFVPTIFLLPEDVGRHVLQFLPQRSSRACMRASRRFHRLLPLPFPRIMRLNDYYSVDKDRCLLGEGSFGVVYRCVCKRTGEPRACKVISKSKINSFGVAQLLLNEIRVHSSLDHANTVPLYETLQSDTDIFAVMGVAGDFELVDYVSDKRQVEEGVAANILTQLLQFLDYLHHTKCIVHRDLKPENIMLSSAHTTIKVVDFGLAKCLGPPVPTLPAAEHTVLCTPCGTLRYCAPEILAPRAYCERIPYDTAFKRDIYSAGVILYVMLTGHLPFRSGQIGELHRQMLKGPRFEASHATTVPPEARDLIRSLLAINPDARPTPAEALTHPWLTAQAARAVAPRANATPPMRPRTKSHPNHEPPILHVHVDVDPEGHLVADQVLQLSAYFDAEPPAASPAASEGSVGPNPLSSPETRPRPSTPPPAAAGIPLAAVDAHL